MVIFTLIQGLKRISHARNSYCAIGISIALLRMIFPSFLFLKPTYKAYRMSDYVCLSETYLDSSVPYDDPRLNLTGIKLVRTDNLRNNETGGVGIDFKEILSVKSVSNNSLKRCLLLEVFIGNKKRFVLSLYRPPSQTQDEFYHFLFLLKTLFFCFFSNW